MGGFTNKTEEMNNTQKLIIAQRELISHLSTLLIKSGFEVIEGNSKWLRLRKKVIKLERKIIKEENK